MRLPPLLRFTAVLIAAAVAACSGESDDPTPDAGQTVDGGQTTPDGGSETPDAGGETPDGGSDEPDAGPPWAPDFYTSFNKSGSRLKARAVKDVNANSAVAWFEDTTLDVRCNVRTATDGKRYCLPESLDVEQAGGYVYADAACTQLAVRVATPCGTPSYVSYRATTLYKATASTATTAYSNGGGSCEGFPIGAGHALVTLAEADLSTFVEFAPAGETIHPIDDAVGVRVLNGAEGSSVGDTLWHRPSNRPAKPVESTVGNTTETRLVPKNPFQWAITTYQRYSCDVADHRFANAFVAEKVDPVPSFVEVTILPGGVAPGSNPWRKVTSTQSTYCDSSGNTITVHESQLVYVLGGPTADFSNLPLLTERDGVGAGTNHTHYLTASGTPAIPKAAIQVGADLHVGTRAVRMATLGESLVGVPAAGFLSSWDQLFANDACTTLAALSDRFAPGDFLVPESTDVGSCLPNLAGAPQPITSVWRVKDEAATTGHPYAWQSMGPGHRECVSTGNSSGGPPPPPTTYRSTEDVTSAATTHLPAVTNAQL